MTRPARFMDARIGGREMHVLKLYRKSIEKTVPFGAIIRSRENYEHDLVPRRWRFEQQRFT